MPCSELIEYLQKFEPDECVSVIIVDLGKRIHYTIDTAVVFNDAEIPTFAFELGRGTPFDEDMGGTDDSA